MDWVKVGEVTHYFSKAGVAVLSLIDDLAVGDRIGFVRNDELLFEQEVASMQVEHKDIDVVAGGSEIGLKVEQIVKVGTEVHRLVEE